MLTLAAGTILDAGAAEVVDAAAAAGFDGFGLRPTEDELTSVALRALRRRIDDSGLTFLDIEVVRFGSAQSPPEQHERLLDAAAALGARWILTVSHHEDRERTAGEVAAYASKAAERGVGVALEFMAFTAVRTLGEALWVLDRVDAPNTGVLVDALHLQRSGGTVADVAAAPPGRIAYAQLCDAPLDAPADLPGEARHHRLMPGRGELPLAEFVRAVGGDAPFSVEVQSDELAAALDPAARAKEAYADARPFLP